jgi:hypothetical protein
MLLPKKKILFITFVRYSVVILSPLWILNYITDKIYPWELIKEFPLLHVLFLLIIFVISYFMSSYEWKKK